MAGVNDFEESLEGIFGRAGLTKIMAVKIGLAGAGGLGSNCAQYLVRSGFKKFKIVDFDSVETSNLNRQFYFAGQVGRAKVEALKENLLLINPALEIEVRPEKIKKKDIGSFFADCDVVVEALDQVEYKRMIIETYMNSGKLLVAASGLAGWGRSDQIIIRRVTEKFYLVGDLASEAGPDCPPLAPCVNVAAAKQADVVLSYILGRPERGVQNEQQA